MAFSKQCGEGGCVGVLICLQFAASRVLLLGLIVVRCHQLHAAGVDLDVRRKERERKVFDAGDLLGGKTPALQVFPDGRRFISCFGKGGMVVMNLAALVMMVVMMMLSTIPTR